MPIRNVGGLNMYYELTGSGPPVVFISGIALDHLPWKLFQVPAFTAAGYRCLVFDKSARTMSSRLHANRAFWRNESRVPD